MMEENGDNMTTINDVQTKAVGSFVTPLILVKAYRFGDFETRDEEVKDAYFHFLFVNTSSSFSSAVLCGFLRTKKGDPLDIPLPRITTMKSSQRTNGRKLLNDGTKLKRKTSSSFETS